MSEGVDLSKVLAANARRIRGSATLDDVARAARVYGANWTPGRVSDLEHGRVSPTLQTLVITALALGDVHDSNVTVAELIESDEKISLTAGFSITSDLLKLMLSGDEDAYSRLVDRAAGAAVKEWDEARRKWPTRLRKVKMGQLWQVSADFGEPETLLARDLGLDRDRLIAEMAGLWGRSFHVERDERAGEGANAQKKGRVARQLKAELKAVLDGDN